MTLASLCSHPPSLLSPKGSPQMIISSTIRCVSWNRSHWDLRPLREQLFREMQIQFTTWGWSCGRKLPGITWRHHDAQSRSFWAGPQVLLLQSSLLRAVYGMATQKQDSVPLWTSCEWRLPPSPTTLPALIHALVHSKSGGGKGSGAWWLIIGLIDDWCTNRCFTLFFLQWLACW